MSTSPNAIDASDINAHKVLPKQPREPALTVLWRTDGPIQSHAAQEPLGQLLFRTRLDAEPDVHRSQTETTFQRVEPRPHARAEAEAVYRNLGDVATSTRARNEGHGARVATQQRRPVEYDGLGVVRQHRGGFLGGCGVRRPREELEPAPHVIPVRSLRVCPNVSAPRRPEAQGGVPDALDGRF